MSRLNKKQKLLIPRPRNLWQKKRKRDGEEDPDEKDIPSIIRKSEDGSVKIAITQNGRMKIKLAAPAASVSVPAATTTMTNVIPQNLIKSQVKGAAAVNKAVVKNTPKPKSRRKGATDDDAAAAAASNITADSNAKDASTDGDFSNTTIEGDYSKAKAPANQIPISQFWSFCENQHFRPLNDEDFAFLECAGDDVTPFICPPLGRHYMDQWLDEDGGGPNASSSYHHNHNYYYESATTPSSSSSSSTSSLSYLATPSASHSVPREYDQVGDVVVGGEVCLGPLSERILATLRLDGVHLLQRKSSFSITSSSSAAAAVNGTHRMIGSSGIGVGGVVEDNDNDDDDFVPSYPKPRTTADMLALEDRLRNELKHLGLIKEDEVTVDAKDDDEISRELRRAQAELRELMDENMARKQRLKEVAAYHRGWEQYCTVLDAVSKQIEADYTKRLKQTPKNKKRSNKSASAAAVSSSATPPPSVPQPRAVVTEATLDLIEKRRMLIENIGCLFPEDRMTMPTRSIYETTETIIPKMEG